MRYEAMGQYAAAARRHSPATTVTQYGTHARHGVGYQAFEYEAQAAAGVGINLEVFNSQGNLSLLAEVIANNRRDAVAGAAIVPWWQPNDGAPPGYHYSVVATMLASGATGHLAFEADAVGDGGRDGKVPSLGRRVDKGSVAQVEEADHRLLKATCYCRVESIGRCDVAEPSAPHTIGSKVQRPGVQVGGDTNDIAILP